MSNEFRSLNKSNIVIKAKERGDKFYREKYYKASASEYSIAIDHIDKNDLDIVFLLSNRCACYLQLKNFESAIDDAKMCVLKRPSWIKGYHRLVTCYINIKKYNNALETCQEGLRMDPYDRFLVKSRSECMEHLNGFPSGSTNSQESSNSRSYDNRSRGNAYSNNGGINPFDFQYLQSTLNRFLQTVINYWITASNNTKAFWGFGFLFIIYILYSMMFPSYYDNYGFGTYDNGFSGLSITTLGLIMYGAYVIPPQLSSIIGPEFAQPFFGMRWTTFLWLLNLLTSRSHGGFSSYRGYNSMNRRRRGFF